MQFKSQISVLGAKSSQGDYNGKPYDSTTIYYEVELQEGENFIGSVGESIKWGKSDNFNKFKSLTKGLTFPVLCDAVIQIVSNGKDTSQILLDLKPVSKGA